MFNGSMLETVKNKIEMFTIITITIIQHCAGDFSQYRKYRNEKYKNENIEI